MTARRRDACGEHRAACAACARSSPRSAWSLAADAEWDDARAHRARLRPAPATSTSGACRASGRSSSRRRRRRSWELGTQLTVTRRPVEAMPLSGSRLFADGLSSWLIRRVSGDDEWAVFDRPAGSERDLVVLAETMGAIVVQRHPNGTVRVVGDVRRAALGGPDVAPRATDGGVDRLGVGVRRPRRSRRRSRSCSSSPSTTSARGASGRSLVYRPDGDPGPTFELRLPTPPALDVRGRRTSRRCATP